MPIYTAYVSIYTCTYMDMPQRLYICTCTHLIYMYTNILKPHGTSLLFYLCKYAHTYTYIYTYICIYVYIHVCKYIYIYIYMHMYIYEVSCTYE